MIELYKCTHVYMKYFMQYTTVSGCTVG